MREDRKLDRIAAEAQAFLLNNQKRELQSDLGSVSSLSKGTIADTVSNAEKSVKSVNKMGKATSKKSITPSVGIGGMTFSKAGKSMAHKFM